MKNKLTNKLFIFAFLFLYALVALISFCHAIEFFNIGNVQWMSVTLAFAFELGLAVCLASILIGTNKRNNIAWLLLTLLVIVQVVGNTYSVFKYISESQVDYYNYLAKPLLFWIQEVSEETVQIIVSWIMGAILPIVALLMTEMVANGIRETQMEDDKALEENPVSEPENESENNHTYIKPLVEPLIQEPIDEDETEDPAERIDPVYEKKDEPKEIDHVDESPVVTETIYEPDTRVNPEIPISNEVPEEAEERIDPSVIENAFKEEKKDVPVIDVAPPNVLRTDDIIRNVIPARKRVSIVDKTLERDAEKLNPEIVSR